eukprot:CAMPEP_0114176254 /NCGR_PEP_ID=MMETSP0043_2-20121206/37392_1 /TAXON_ID=464988 /ORGANISM="Hemiselmis andersenii, Strain CCMP644" /LENGTH=186 /DNA_ID=CAMNT_0001274547 /DNA_START=53 /DNA_END=610 /DNA_ORIENTATION=-
MKAVLSSSPRCRGLDPIRHPSTSTHRSECTETAVPALLHSDEYLRVIVLDGPKATTPLSPLPEISFLSTCALPRCNHSPVEWLSEMVLPTMRSGSLCSSHGPMPIARHGAVLQHKAAALLRRHPPPRVVRDRHPVDAHKRPQVRDQHPSLPVAAHIALAKRNMPPALHVGTVECIVAQVAPHALRL